MQDLSRGPGGDLQQCRLEVLVAAAGRVGGPARRQRLPSESCGGCLSVPTCDWPAHVAAHRLGGQAWKDPAAASTARAPAPPSTLGGGSCLWPQEIWERPDRAGGWAPHRGLGLKLAVAIGWMGWVYGV